MGKKTIEKETQKLERKKDKIETYTTRIVEEHGGKVVVSKLSTYYNINGKILRISNHIGTSSSGNISIIIPTYDSRQNTQSNYIIHFHQTGEISVMDYEDVKELVRCYGKMSSMIHNAYQPNFEFQFEVRDQFDAKMEEQKVYVELTRLKTIEQKYNSLVESIKKKTTSEVAIDYMNPTEIFGVPIRYFTDGQMKTLKATAKVALSNAIKRNKLPEDKEKLKMLESQTK